MRKHVMYAALAGLLFCGASRAADEPPTTAAAPPPATTQPATTRAGPTTQPVALDVSSKQAMSTHVGQHVAVEGTVTYAAWSATGRVFVLRMREGQPTQFQAALFSRARPAMEKAFHGDLSQAFEGARVRIVGKLQTFREHPEIVIDDPTQVTILVPPPATTQPGSGK
jgi:DNA/RNA endonuclease YhcR with UshA esterase domain